jgi:hypothetical protein
MTSLIIDQRFRGPPNSANGGYFSGCVAALCGSTVTVRLMRPPPLDTPMEVTQREEGVVEVLHGDNVIARTRPGEANIVVPKPPSYVEAVEASRHYVGFDDHPFPTCFVCGPHRARGDGLRIFAGLVADGRFVAAPWVPDASLDFGDGKVRPEFMAAAMDCPGCFAANREGRGNWLLGEFTAHVDRRVHIDERCIVIGWHIRSSGRKHEAGTALFDEDGEPVGRAHAIWIEPRQEGAPAAG